MSEGGEKTMISTSKNFQSSVNIAYDIGNLGKVRSFIPTTENVNFILKILRSAGKKENVRRSHILIGPYGKGKSHVVLETLAFLSRDKSKKFLDCIESVVEKIKAVNPSSASEIMALSRKGKRLLPIIINGNSSKLSQVFLSALRTALNQEELKNLMPETHFEAAARMIEKWEKDFPQTLENFNKKASVRSKKFKEKLRNFEPDALSEFECLYPLLTSGSEFNPYSGFDVVDIYEKVCRKLCDTGLYDGIFVVYDEFGKYLESNISRATIEDVKLLQDFAERCDRSFREEMHFLLICHKEIENYIDVLPKQKIDGWRGVSERFEHIRFFNDDNDSYELICASIIKNFREWKKFKAENQIGFNVVEKKWLNESSLFMGVDKIPALKKTIIEGCYPLHPVTTFILPRLSEMVAQNERTLFTFLAGNGKYSFENIWRKECEKKKDTCQNLLWISPDVLYDYFESQFCNESYSENIKKIYRTVSVACRKFRSGSLESKIAKAIFLIGILDRNDRIAPTQEILYSIYEDVGFSTKEVQTALKKLSTERVLYESSNSGFLEIKKDSGIDISRILSDEVEKRKNLFKATSVLNTFNKERFLYPTSYNIQRKMIRYFRFLFVNAEECALENFDAIEKKEFADGFVYAIYGNSDVPQIQKISQKKKDSVFIILRKNDFKQEILRKFDALTVMRERAGKDSAFFEECDMMYRDLEKILSMICSEYLSPELLKADYIFQGEKNKIDRKAELSKILSQICREKFSLTPIVNNEILNKNTLTGIAQKSRAKLIDAILNSSSGNLGLLASSQEGFFMKSALVVPGILDDESERKIFSLKPKTERENAVRFENLFSVISEFLKKSENAEISFGELFEKLTGSKEKIGLRLGVIPIYIAVAISENLKTAIIRKNQVEIPLNSSTLNEISENPDIFTIRMQFWNDEREKYIAGLEKLFAEKIDLEEKKKSGFGYLGNAIFRWYRSLPQYVKQMQRTNENGKWISVSKNYLNLMKTLKQELLGIQEFLFEKLPNAFGQDEGNLKVYEELRNAKEFFDSSMSRTETRLAIEIRNEIAKICATCNASKSLKNLLVDFSLTFSSDVENHIFENNAQLVLAAYKNAENDDVQTVRKLARILTGLSPDDWNDLTYEAFLKRLRDANESLCDYRDSQKSKRSAKSDYAIRFGENSSSKTFEKIKISPRAKILQDELSRTISEMGASITEAEKRQVLANMLEALC